MFRLCFFIFITQPLHSIAESNTGISGMLYLFIDLPKLPEWIAGYSSEINALKYDLSFIYLLFNVSHYKYFLRCTSSLSKAIA